MKAGWLSKHFGAKAGVVASLLTATAATAAVYASLPYQVDEIVAQAPEVKPTYAQKKIPVHPITVVAPKRDSLFIHTEPQPADTDYNGLYSTFCKEFTDQCGWPRGGTSAVFYNAHIAQMLSNVNVGVNRAVEFKSDTELYGSEGKFAIPTAKGEVRPQGDCEDYSLLKRKMLKEYLPAETMMMGFVTNKETGGSHAVLVVRTTAGDFVLDNRHDEVKLARDTEYKFNWLSKPENEMRLSAVKTQDETHDTALLNLTGAKATFITVAAPSMESVQLALAPAAPKDNVVVLAQATPPVSVLSAAAPLPSATPALR